MPSVSAPITRALLSTREECMHALRQCVDHKGLIYALSTAHTQQHPQAACRGECSEQKLPQRTAALPELLGHSRVTCSLQYRGSGEAYTEFVCSTAAGTSSSFGRGTAALWIPSGACSRFEGP